MVDNYFNHSRVIRRAGFLAAASCGRTLHQMNDGAFFSERDKAVV
jgi:hypothetical protein